MFNGGGWLVHVDFALDTEVDYLAVVEHRLIPARVRSEWPGLRSERLASIWAPASQDSSHVGNVLLLPPTFATAQFRRFFDCGRAIRFLLPLGGSRCMNLVVLYGYQGVDTDTEQLGDFNVEPTNIPCLAKGISAGLWVDLEAAWAPTSGVQPAVTCGKRAWDSTGGHRRDFMVGCTLAAAALSSCRVDPGRWVTPPSGCWGAL